MNKKFVRLSTLFVLMSSFALAQEKDSTKVNQLEEVVISDTKFAQSKEKSGKVITKITQEELQKKSGQSLTSILSSVAGVEINGNQSVNGKNLGIYIRGGSNHQVLVLIDGIPVTDASGINLEYDLRLLPVEQVESIEIMKGASSTLYGTGAATGLINITLKKTNKKAIEGTAYLNMGSNNNVNDSKVKGHDFNQGFSVSAKNKAVRFYTGLNSTESNGMSQIASPKNEKYEADRFSRQNVLSRLGFTISKKLFLDFFGNYDKTTNSYDGTFDNTGLNDNSINRTSSEQFRVGFIPKYTYKNGELVLNSSLSKLTREYSEFNSFANAVEGANYQSRSAIFDLINKIKLMKEISLVTGINYQFHDMSTQTVYGDILREGAKFSLIDPYATFIYNSNFGLNVNAGARLNVHSEYGNQVVYNVNPSYNFEKLPLKIISSLSTAFVTPSLYQLYSEYGNLKLTPEKNTTVEVGFETILLDKKLTLNSVGFFREQDNSFGFFFDPITFDSYYINIDGLNKSKGIETELRYKLSNAITLNSNYTFTEVDEKLRRLIPKHKVNTSIDVAITKRCFLNASYQYVDDRNDAFFDGATFGTIKAKLDSYQLVNSSLQYQLIKNRMSIFGAVTNILNEDFVENIGYSTRGRNFKLGMSLSF
jgi:vitamin B12 transporter